MTLFIIAILTNARSKKPSYEYLHQYKHTSKDEAIEMVKALSKKSKKKYVVCRMFEYQ